MNKKFSSEILKGRDRTEDLGVDEKILEWTMRNWGGKVWTGCIWLWIGSSGGLLWTR